MFIIKSQRKRALGLNEPLKHGSHKKPVTRRDFLAQGFTTGAATVMVPALSTLSPRQAKAALSGDLPDLAALTTRCGLTGGDQRIPFICFDLAGGANIAGSNVLVGQQGGQLDFLSTQGYSKLGLPGNMLPNNSTTNFVNAEFGLAFHSDSAFLRGMLEKTTATTRARVNGAVIAARSENDTGNNPHNPMYGLAKWGVKSNLLTLIGSQNSESGGNSMSPAMYLNPEFRPTKIDRVSDVTGLVDTGDVAGILSDSDTVRTLETMYRLSNRKLGNVSTGLAGDADVKSQFKCAYLKSAATVDKFSDPTLLNPSIDPDVLSIFGANFGGDREFEKTASVMKLVIDGNAGAGTITMGGFDYHTGERATGEERDLRAGRCIGACLEYAALNNKPLMLYVFSDGSLSSNGMIDDSAGGRGKGQWTGDNQQTAASFFLVFNPLGRPTLLGADAAAQARHQQIGYYSAGGDVVTSSSPAANNVNLLVQTVILNYMALHGQQGDFTNKFGNALGGSLDGLTAFTPIVTGPVT
ncbi:general secretion pathway protein GspF [Peristeroidobacter agariperforans]|uniref:general secretion pathway protein GspF n=1 Tax=Peristeroidobacter agariperforans TaxID=268404 RepID=UPI00101BF933|nr:general secretion pathway protein GspF [Peristeroidobacter agariperforans]